jgi:ferredoxin
MGMKIEVDWDLCEANAICQRVAPEVFKVDDSDTLHVLQERPAEPLREKLEIAVKRCPRKALKLVEE